MKHAAGVARLVEQRGPDMYKDDLDQTMLFSFRSMIVMRCLFSGEECFLAQTKWQKVLTGHTQDRCYDSDEQRVHIRLVDVYCANLAKLPRVLRIAVRIRDAMNHGMPIDMPSVVALKKYAGRLYQDFTSWYDEFVAVIGAPAEAPSEDPSSPYETVLTYSNNWFGAVYLGYWATMLIVQESLRRVSFDPKYHEQNKQTARNIYRSFENVSKGIMGPYRVGFSMYFSYGFADIPTQHWIRSLVSRMSPMYGATNVAAYPPPTPNEFMFN
jgi:hypothetical protein